MLRVDRHAASFRRSSRETESGTDIVSPNPGGLARLYSFRRPIRFFVLRRQKLEAQVTRNRVEFQRQLEESAQREDTIQKARRLRSTYQ